MTPFVESGAWKMGGMRPRSLSPASNNYKLDLAACTGANTHSFSLWTGAILNEVPPDDKPTSLNFAGSMLVMVAETKEEIVTSLKNDIYGTSGVWDVDNVSIWVTMIP